MSYYTDKKVDAEVKVDKPLQSVPKKTIGVPSAQPAPQLKPPLPIKPSPPAPKPKGEVIGKCTSCGVDIHKGESWQRAGQSTFCARHTQ